MKPETNGNEPLMKLHNVGVYYSRRTGFFRRERFWALKDVSLDLRSGETLGIIGRNGAGKTTLLRILAGIIRPNKGQIVHNNVRASLLSLQVGFSPHLSGRDNAILSGMLLGLPRREVEAKMDEIIAFAELEEFIDQPMRTYSTGMRARLGFSVAFQANPDLLLLDEVLGVGDAAFKEKSTAAMREKICSDQTVVLVSHSPATIREICDRVIWIHDGVTRAEGETETILKAYLEDLAKRKQRSIAPVQGIAQQFRLLAK